MLKKRSLDHEGILELQTLAREGVLAHMMCEYLIAQSSSLVGKSIVLKK